MTFYERGVSCRWKWRYLRWWAPCVSRQVYYDGVKGGFWGAWGPFRFDVRLIRMADDTRYWFLDYGWR